LIPRDQFEALLEVFWSSHEPTRPHRTGPDEDSQYCSGALVRGASSANDFRTASFWRREAKATRRLLRSSRLPSVIIFSAKGRTAFAKVVLIRFYSMRLQTWLPAANFDVRLSDPI
jgi:hypothetical protein